MDRHLAALAARLSAVVDAGMDERDEHHAAAYTAVGLLARDAERATEHATERETAWDPVVALHGSFGLTEVERSILVVAASADLDERFAVTYDAMLGSVGLHRPTVGLLLRLVGVRPEEGRRLLADGSALRRNGLLSLHGEEPFALRTVSVPDRVLAYLEGDQRASLDVRRLVRSSAGFDGDLSAAIGEALDCGMHLVHVRTAPGSPGVAAAEAAFADRGSGSLVVDLSARDRTLGPRALLGDVVREAGLRRVGLVLTGVDDLLERDPSLVTVIDDGPALAVVVDDYDWSLPPSSHTVRIDAVPLTRAQRHDVWTAALDDIGVETGDSAELAGALCSMRLAPETIRAAVETAARLIDAPEDLTRRALEDAARVTAGQRLTSTAVRVVPTASTGDLILNEANENALAQLISWGRLREGASGRALLGGRRGGSSGVTALFAGPPGTGKTLAAEVVAAELGLELYVINLSQVVDKYIGETEKRLEQVITESENLGVILLFDEADSIFGSRSAVKDSKDRYANQTVSYLLQRIERYDGIIILTSNFRGNIDPAFTRRLHHIIHFPEPDARARRRMWQVHLSVLDTDPGDPVDLDLLSDRLELVGAEIRNVVMRAGFAALGDDPDQPRIGMRQLLDAAAQEYAKTSKLLPSIAMPSYRVGDALAGSTARRTTNGSPR